MPALVRHLTSYSAYHRNPHNVLTHMIGVPLIVFSIEVLTSRPYWTVGPLVLAPSILLSVAAAIFYLALDASLGLVMTALLAMGAWIGLQLAAMTTTVWLGVGIGTFVIGWAIQFVGHAFEGRKPAFLDDITGLIIGPLFIVAEIAFAIGARQGLKKAIDASFRE